MRREERPSINSIIRGAGKEVGVEVHDRLLRVSAIGAKQVEGRRANVSLKMSCKFLASGHKAGADMRRQIKQSRVVKLACDDCVPRHFLNQRGEAHKVVRL